MEEKTPEGIPYKEWTSFRMFRILRKFTQEEMAEKLGIAVTTLHRWETMKVIPDPMGMLQVSEILGVSPMTIWDPSDYPQVEQVYELKKMKGLLEEARKQELAQGGLP